MKASNSHLTMGDSDIEITPRDQQSHIFCNSLFQKVTVVNITPKIQISSSDMSTKVTMDSKSEALSDKHINKHTSRDSRDGKHKNSMKKHTKEQTRMLDQQHTISPIFDEDDLDIIGIKVITDLSALGTYKLKAMDVHKDISNNETNEAPSGIHRCPVHHRIPLTKNAVEGGSDALESSSSIPSQPNTIKSKKAMSNTTTYSSSAETSRTDFSNEIKSSKGERCGQSKHESAMGFTDIPKHTELNWMDPTNQNEHPENHNCQSAGAEHEGESAVDDIPVQDSPLNLVVAPVEEVALDLTFKHQEHNNKHPIGQIIPNDQFDSCNQKLQDDGLCGIPTYGDDAMGNNESIGQTQAGNGTGHLGHRTTFQSDRQTDHRTIKTPEQHTKSNTSSQEKSVSTISTQTLPPSTFLSRIENNIERHLQNNRSDINATELKRSTKQLSIVEWADKAIELFFWHDQDIDAKDSDSTQNISKNIVTASMTDEDLGKKIFSEKTKSTSTEPSAQSKNLEGNFPSKIPMQSGDQLSMNEHGSEITRCNGGESDIQSRNLDQGHFRAEFQNLHESPIIIDDDSKPEKRTPAILALLKRKSPLKNPMQIDSTYQSPAKLCRKSFPGRNENALTTPKETLDKVSDDAVCSQSRLSCQSQILHKVLTKSIQTSISPKEYHLKDVSQEVKNFKPPPPYNSKHRVVLRGCDCSSSSKHHRHECGGSFKDLQHMMNPPTSMEEISNRLEDAHKYIMSNSALNASNAQLSDGTLINSQRKRQASFPLSHNEQHCMIQKRLNRMSDEKELTTQNGNQIHQSDRNINQFPKSIGKTNSQCDCLPCSNRYHSDYRVNQGQFTDNEEFLGSCQQQMNQTDESLLQNSEVTNPKNHNYGPISKHIRYGSPEYTLKKTESIDCGFSTNSDECQMVQSDTNIQHQSKPARSSQHLEYGSISPRNIRYDYNYPTCEQNKTISMDSSSMREEWSPSNDDPHVTPSQVKQHLHSHNQRQKQDSSQQTTMSAMSEEWFQANDDPQVAPSQVKQNLHSHNQRQNQNNAQQTTMPNQDARQIQHISDQAISIISGANSKIHLVEEPVVYVLRRNSQASAHRKNCETIATNPCEVLVRREKDPGANSQSVFVSDNSNATREIPSESSMIHRHQTFQNENPISDSPPELIPLDTYLDSHYNSDSMHDETSTDRMQDIDDSNAASNQRVLNFTLDGKHNQCNSNNSCQTRPMTTTKPQSLGGMSDELYKLLKQGNPEEINSRKLDVLKKSLRPMHDKQVSRCQENERLVQIPLNTHITRSHKFARSVQCPCSQCTESH